MKLLPFDSNSAKKLIEIFVDESYSGFTRHFGRMLTLSEIENLPAVIGQEVVFGVDGDDLIGMATMNHLPHRVCSWGIAVLKKYQNHGMFSDLLDLVEKYCYNVRDIRMLTTGTVGSSQWQIEPLKRRGYKMAGTLPEYSFINGKFEDIIMYYKMR
jgi:RimJ/RimL family protein N-acetyltransferase